MWKISEPRRICCDAPVSVGTQLVIQAIDLTSVWVHRFVGHVDDVTTPDNKVEVHYSVRYEIAGAAGSFVMKTKKGKKVFTVENAENPFEARKKVTEATFRLLEDEVLELLEKELHFRRIL